MHRPGFTLRGQAAAPQRDMREKPGIEEWRLLGYDNSGNVAILGSYMDDAEAWEGYEDNAEDPGNAEYHTIELVEVLAIAES